MNYTKFNFLNRLIDKLFDKFKEPLLRRRFIAKRFKAYEYIRKKGEPIHYDHIPISDWRKQYNDWARQKGSKSDNFHLVAWEYMGRILTTVIVVLAIAVPTGLKIWNNHQRSLANAAIWVAVQANNMPTGVVSPSTIAVTMPCKATEASGINKDLLNNSDFTGTSYSCNLFYTSYSTKNLSLDDLHYAVQPEAGQSTSDSLAYWLNNIDYDSYLFEVDTMRNGVSPNPYLMQCVSSTQDSNNASDGLGEVMNVAYDGAIDTQTLGRATVFNICELVGTEGTVTASAETVQNNTIIQLSILTDSSHTKGLLNKLTAYMDSVHFE